MPYVCVIYVTAVVRCKAGHWNAPLGRTSIMNIAIHPGRVARHTAANLPMLKCHLCCVFARSYEIQPITKMGAKCVFSTLSGTCAQITFLHVLPSSCVNVSGRHMSRAFPGAQCVTVSCTCHSTKATVDVAVREWLRKQRPRYAVGDI
jgi:hypothetical protein